MPDVTRTRTVITAFTLVSVLALGACSDDDPEPKFAPTPSPSTSAPTSPSTTAASGPVEPTMPAAAKGTDAASAEAFVKFYWEMVAYAQETGHLDGLKVLSDSTCLPCKRGIAYLKSVFDRDGEIAGGVGTVHRLSTGFVNDDGDEKAVVEFELTNTRQQVDFPGTHRDKEFPAGTLSMTAMLGHAGNGWVMTYWGES